MQSLICLKSLPNTKQDKTASHYNLYVFIFVYVYMYMYMCMYTI